MEEFLIASISNYGFLVYGLIVFLAIIEGPILSILIGTLIQAGCFPFLPVYITLMLGDLLGDCIWYMIGKRYGNGFIIKYGKYFKITEEGVVKVTDIFHRHKTSILMISKSTNGFGFALVTLMTAGMIGIPFRTYIFINSIGQLIWTGMLVATGYFFAQLFVFIELMVGRISAITTAILVGVLLYALYRRVRDKIIKKI